MMKKINKINIPHLLLLDYLKEKYSLTTQTPFKGYACVFIQHLLCSNLSLIKALEDGGIERNNLYIIGKAYSSNQEVLIYLDENKYHYVNAIEHYSLENCYDDILICEIRRVILNLVNNTDLDILLLDDAAKGIGIIHEEPFLQHISRFKCVELTTRGIRGLKEINVRCPVVDIASSYTKRNIESVLIGESMSKGLLNFLKLWEPVFKPINREVLIIGYGAIGEQVCKILKKIFHISIYDIDKQRCIKACNDGLKLVKNITNVHYGIIIGCTGVSFNLRELQTYSETLFINMSSSDLEFGLWRFNGEKNKASNVYNFSVSESSLHEFYIIDSEGKRFYVANGGFPIDFDGSLDPIAPEKIQITRALVLAACIQVLSETTTGIIKLNDKIQNELNNYKI